MSYNGWKSYETWAVNLWISNDQGTANHMEEMAAEHRRDAPGTRQVREGVWSVALAAKVTLADSLKEWVEDELLPDLGASLAADLLNAAMSEVDWNELAEHALADLPDDDDE